MNERAAYFLSWILLFVGAIMIADILRQAYLESAVPIASPVGVAQLLGGVVLVAVGWRLERGSDPSEFVTDPDPGGDDEEWSEDEYIFSDEELERGPEE